jgi:uncharacterized protein
MYSSKPLRFDHGYTFFENLRVDTLNKGRDLLIGSVSENESPSAILLGKNAEFNGLMGRDIWLDTEGAHVVYVVGKRRSGKSYTLGTIAEGLVTPNLQYSESKQACLILDTLNIFWTMEQGPYDEEQKKELNKWGIASSNISNIQCFYPKGSRHDFYPENYIPFSIKPCDLTGNDWANMFELDPIVDPMGQLFSELHEKVSIDGYSTRTQDWKPNPEFNLSDLIQCLENDIELQRFPVSVKEAVRRRIKSIQKLPLFSSEGISVQTLFTKNKISILLLRDLDQNVRGLIIGLIVRKIMELRGPTHESEKRLELLLNSKQGSDADIARLQQLIQTGIPRGWILIDEAHNFIPNSGIIASRPVLKKYVNEGRNIGLSIAVATQQPSGLDASIRRNADILLVHKITMSTDLSATQAMLSTSIPDSVEINSKKTTSKVFDNMVRELPLGYVIISASNANRIMLGKIRPRISVHGGVEY